MGKRDSPKREWDTGVCDPGASKLDHLRLVKLILFQNFTTFVTFILGAPISYYPSERKQQGLEMRKGDSTKSERDTGVCDPGAFKLDHLLPVKLILPKTFSTFLTFILGLPFRITPERGTEEAAGAGNGKKGFSQK